MTFFKNLARKMMLYLYSLFLILAELLCYNLFLVTVYEK